MARTAIAKRRKRTNFAGFLLIALVVGIIAFVMFLQSRGVKSKLSAYTAQEQTLDSQIAAEEERTGELEEFEKYVQTKAYAGEQAQEKLGLVNDGEIIFRKE